MTPLLLTDQPVVALPYAYHQLAQRIAAAPAVALTLTDARMTGSGWQPLVVLGRPQLVDDHDGAIFTEQLLTQELMNYPPSRALADSLMLRREHWWYLPRLLILVDVTSAYPIQARRDPADLVVAVAPEQPAAPDVTVARDEATLLTVDTVRVDEPGALDAGASSAAARLDQVRVTSLTGRSLPDGAAALLGHDFSVPDLERWTSWVTKGRVADGLFRIDKRPARTTLEPTLSLWQRFRRQRNLERGCRDALNVNHPR